MCFIEKPPGFSQRLWSNGDNSIVPSAPFSPPVRERCFDKGWAWEACLRCLHSLVWDSVLVCSPFSSQQLGALITLSMFCNGWWKSKGNFFCCFWLSCMCVVLIYNVPEYTDLQHSVEKKYHICTLKIDFLLDLDPSVTTDPMVFTVFFLHESITWYSWSRVKDAIWW